MNKINLSSYPPHVSPAVSSQSAGKSSLIALLELFKNASQNQQSREVESSEIRNRIHDLTDRLIKIETSLKVIKDQQENLRKQIEALEGGKIAKIFIIGALIKLFYRFYHRHLLSKTYSQYAQLQKAQQSYQQQLQELDESLKFQQSLLNQKENKNSLENSIREIEKTSKNLSQISSISSEELPQIFEVENEIRKILNSSHFPEQQRCQEVYRREILRVVNLAKQHITQRPFHFAVQAAAERGKAAQAGLLALKALAENQPVLQPSAHSSQDVFLLPKYGTVFKRADKRAKEEERNTNELFHLMSKQAVVGTFDIQRASIEKFGIQISEKIQERGFTPKALSPQPELKRAIKKKLSPEDQLILENYEKSPSKRDENADNYARMAKKQWYLKLPNQQWREISFQELQRRFLANQLPPEAQIGLDQNQGLSLEKHILEGTSFAQALNHIPSLKASPPDLYLTPDLSDEQNRKAYEHCEQFKWSYKDSQGIKHEADFKTVHALYLQNKIRRLYIEPIASPSSSQSLPTYTERNQALDVHWKAVTPELMELASDEVKVTELTDIQAKPFVNMILMKNLSSSAREKVLEKLTSDAQFNAILTGELQLLDLHATNLGVVPKLNAEYEKFKDLKFSVSSYSNINFNDLMILYLNGTIHPSTPIRLIEAGQVTQKPLNALPDLQKALDVHWQFVIFDTDLSLSEDNWLQIQTRKETNRVNEHLIPLRSVLLETRWKDTPLSEATIKRLMESEERDLRVKSWIRREDAPIYRRFSEQAKESIAKQLAPMLEDYTLSKLRPNNTDITLKDLQKNFVAKLSDLSQKTPSHVKQIWKIIETELSTVTVRPHDTLKTIAQRYHQDIQTLKRLNPDLNLQSGKKIKIEYDLSSPQAEKRRRRIATQLFPRLTIRQQNALLERQSRRRDYLMSYQALSRSSLQGLELMTQISEFIEQPQAPLTTVRREQLLKELRNNKKLNDRQALMDFKQALCKECQPTYFNLMKAMYPLLADAYALAEVVYGKDQAGQYIGWYRHPLEEIIQNAKSRYSKASSAYRLAEHLERQIAKVANPAFFGDWTS
jgi:LysM repeat protein